MKKILNIPELNFLKVAIEKNLNFKAGNKNFEFLDKQDAIAVLVLNNKEDKTLLVKQYRPGAQKDIFEIPAGLIENGESALKTLEREIREETGYLRKDYDIIYSKDEPFYVTPGYSTEKIYLFIIKLISDDVKALDLDLDEDEFLSPEWFNLEEVEDISLDMKTNFALQIYKSMK